MILVADDVVKGIREFVEERGANSAGRRISGYDAYRRAIERSIGAVGDPMQSAAALTGAPAQLPTETEKPATEQR